MAEETTKPGPEIRCSAGIFPWWLILLWGVLTLIIGVMFLTTPVITIGIFITFIGAFWLAGGIFSLAGLAVDRSAAGLKIFLSAINIIAVALIMVYPLYSAVFVFSFFVIFISFLACLIGCSYLITAFRNKDAGNGVLGVISLVFGILLFFFPLVTAATIPFIAGAFCVVSGISGIIASLMAKGAQGSSVPP